mgnify:CR=1 FL=1
MEERKNESSSDIPTNISPFVDEIFRSSEAHDPTAPRRAPGPATQAVADALDEVAQQKKASSIPSRKRKLNRLGGRNNRELSAEMHNHNQHRLRLHHRHRNHLADDPESNSGWYLNPSPPYFSGKKKVRKYE